MSGNQGEEDDTLITIGPHMRISAIIHFLYHLWCYRQLLLNQ